MLKIGIITTIADAADSIDAFIFYHQQIGIENFYIFVDDNDVDTIDRLKMYPQVKAFLKNDLLRQKWKKYFPKLENEKLSLIDQEVMVRQELNFHYGFELAKEEGVDWVIHLDLDELFYPNGHQLSEYFAQLQLSNIRAVTYLNYESISTEPEAESIYLSSQYFKINYLKYRTWLYNKEQKAFLQSADWLRKKYFLFYQNGKSSVSTYGSNIKFYDVHSIFGDGNRKFGGHTDPLVLHFPCARFSDFVKKYNRLGKFSDIWMGLPRAGEFIDTMHLNARDYVSDPKNLDLETFYRAHFLMEQSQIEQLCQLNLAKHIDLSRLFQKISTYKISE